MTFEIQTARQLIDTMIQDSAERIQAGLLLSDATSLHLAGNEGKSAYYARLAAEIAEKNQSTR